MLSLGIGSFCKMIDQDECTAIYAYGAYNLNLSPYKNEKHICDGIITIAKNGLVEPAIHEKTKRLPNGKKQKLVKRVANDIPISELLKNKKITIQNCSCCWETNEDGIDVLALTTVWYIFLEYQENGFLPETLHINQ